MRRDFIDCFGLALAILSTLILIGFSTLLILIGSVFLKIIGSIVLTFSFLQLSVAFKEMMEGEL